MAQATYREIETYISNRERFEGSSAHAENVGQSFGGMSAGRLNTAEWNELADGIRDGRVSYVVSSYGTPIAWVVDGRPHVTEQHFSPTTSRIQKICSRFL